MFSFTFIGRLESSCGTGVSYNTVSGRGKLWPRHPQTTTTTTSAREVTVVLQVVQGQPDPRPAGWRALISRTVIYK